MLVKNIQIFCYVLSDPAEFLRMNAQIRSNLKLKQTNWGWSLVCLSRMQQERLLRPFQAFWAEGGGWRLSGELSVSSEGCLRTSGSSCP